MPTGQVENWTDDQARAKRPGGRRSAMPAGQLPHPARRRAGFRLRAALCPGLRLCAQMVCRYRRRGETGPAAGRDRSAQLPGGARPGPGTICPRCRNPGQCQGRSRPLQITGAVSRTPSQPSSSPLSRPLVDAQAGIVQTDQAARRPRPASISAPYTRIIAPFDDIVTNRTIDVRAAGHRGRCFRAPPLFTGRRTATACTHLRAGAAGRYGGVITARHDGQLHGCRNIPATHFSPRPARRQRRCGVQPVGHPSGAIPDRPLTRDRLSIRPGDSADVAQAPALPVGQWRHKGAPRHCASSSATARPDGGGGGGARHQSSC